MLKKDDGEWMSYTHTLVDGIIGSIEMREKGGRRPRSWTLEF